MWYSTKRDNQSHKIVDESDLQSNFFNKGLIVIMIL